MDSSNMILTTEGFYLIYNIETNTLMATVYITNDDTLETQYTAIRFDTIQQLYTYVTTNSILHNTYSGTTEELLRYDISSEAIVYNTDTSNFQYCIVTTSFTNILIDITDPIQ